MLGKKKGDELLMRSGTQGHPALSQAQWAKLKSPSGLDDTALPEVGEILRVYRMNPDLALAAAAKAMNK
jgi:hypothetical protein